MKKLILFILITSSLISCKSQDTTIKGRLIDETNLPVIMGKYISKNDTVYAEFYLIKKLHIHNPTEEILFTAGIAYYVNDKLFDPKIGPNYIESISESYGQMEILYLGPNLKVMPQTDLNLLIGIPFTIPLTIKEFEVWKNKGIDNESYWKGHYLLSKKTGILRFLMSRIPKDVQKGSINLMMGSKNIKTFNILIPVEFK